METRRACLTAALSALALTGCHISLPVPPPHPTLFEGTANSERVHVVPQIGHAQPVRKVAWARDGHVVASIDGPPGGVGALGILKVWDVATGAVVTTWSWNDGDERDQDGVRAIAASPDGRRLLVGSQRLRLVDATTGRTVGTFPALRYMPLVMQWVPEAWTAVAFSPDGRRAAAGQTTGKLRVLDVASWSVTAEPSSHGDEVTAIVFSPDAKTAASASKDGAIRLWDAATGDTLRQLSANGAVASLRFSADGARLAAAADDTRVFDARTGALVQTIPGKAALAAFAADGAVRTRTGAPPADMSADGRRWIVAEADALRVRDVATGNELAALRRGTRPIETAVVSRALERAAVTEQGGVTRVWDLSALRELRSFSGYRAPLALSPNGASFMALAGGDPTLLDAVTGAAPHPLPGPFGARDTAFASFLEDGVHLVALSRAAADDWSVRLWDVRAGAPRVARLVGARGDEAILSDDGRSALLLAADGTIRAWDLATAAPLGDASMFGKSDRQIARVFFPDEKHVVIAREGEIELYDAATWSAVRVMFLPERQMAARVALSPSAERALVAVDDGSIALWDLENQSVIRRLEGHSGPITALSFARGDTCAFSASDDGSMRAWRLDDGASVAMIALGDEWAAYADDGTFDSSRRGGELVAAVEDMRPFSIQQLAARNNRPDLLLERLGLGEGDLRAYLRARHERRLHKLGVTEGALASSFAQAPEARIGDVKQDGKTAHVSFDLTARGAPLLRYNVWVDDVPLYGALGRETSGRAQHLEADVELTSGANKIEVGATDAGGADSLRPFRVVQYREPTKGDLYLVAFGVSRYANPKYDLDFADKDALDLGEVARAMKGTGAFVDVHVATYVNEQATTTAIDGAKELLKTAKVDDTVVLFVGGHGVHALDAAAEYYFATYETDVHDLPHTAADFERVEGLLQGILPRRKLFLMDTCESGERDDDELPPDAAPTSGSRGLRARAVRAFVLDARAGAPRARPPRRFLFDRDRYIENDLERRSGAIVLSSSRGAEFSYELPSIENGAFTEEVLTALVTPVADVDRDGAVSTDELRAFVAAEVPKLTEDRQHPTVDRDNLDVRFGLPVVLSAAPILHRVSVAPPPEPDAGAP